LYRIRHRFDPPDPLTLRTQARDRAGGRQAELAGGRVQRVPVRRGAHDRASAQVYGAGQRPGLDIGISLIYYIGYLLLGVIFGARFLRASPVHGRRYVALPVIVNITSFIAFVALGGDSHGP
jgi:hypothetical protein